MSKYKFEVTVEYWPGRHLSEEIPKGYVESYSTTILPHMNGIGQSESVRINGFNIGEVKSLNAVFNLSEPVNGTYEIVKVVKKIKKEEELFTKSTLENVLEGCIDAVNVK